MTSKRELEESIDELRRSYGKLHSEVWDVLDLRSFLKEFDGVKYVLRYIIEENKTFKTDLIKNYIKAKDAYNKYMEKTKEKRNKATFNGCSTIPYFDVHADILKIKIDTIEHAYKFLYDESISDGTIKQYATMLDKDDEKVE